MRASCLPGPRSVHHMPSTTLTRPAGARLPPAPSCGSEGGGWGPSRAHRCQLVPWKERNSSADPLKFDARPQGRKASHSGVNLAAMPRLSQRLAASIPQRANKSRTAKA